MPRFVLKDMEALYLDETRSSINLLIANLESVPVNPKGASSKKTLPNSNAATPDRSSSRFHCLHPHSPCHTPTAPRLGSIFMG